MNESLQLFRLAQMFSWGSELFGIDDFSLHDNANKCDWLARNNQISKFVSKTNDIAFKQRFPKITEIFHLSFYIFKVIGINKQFLVYRFQNGIYIL